MKKKISIFLISYARTNLEYIIKYIYKSKKTLIYYFIYTNFLYDRSYLFRVSLFLISYYLMKFIYLLSFINIL